jgi:hypothetical protein
VISAANGDNSAIVHITDSAAEELERQLEREAPSSEYCFRIITEGDTRYMHIDTPRPGDTTFQHGGRTLLVMDPATVKEYAGLVIVYDADQGSFAFVPPVEDD